MDVIGPDHFRRPHPVAQAHMWATDLHLCHLVEGADFPSSKNPEVISI